MTKLQLKKWASLLVKILLTGAALFFVFKKVDLRAFVQSVSLANPYYILLAFAAFNISKIISSFRLLVLYQLAGVNISGRINLGFYYMGMFYNMFLPGSIGGDAYKVYLIKQAQQETSLKKLMGASLLDRLSGVSQLFIMAGVFMYLSTYHSDIPYFDLYLWLGVLSIIPAYYFVVKFLFPSFLEAFAVTAYYSLFVQLGQVICAVFILKALHIDLFYWDYLTLFMLSSVAAIIPLTIGGIGSREMVFLFGAQFLQINKTTSVAFALLFFMVSAASSLIGIFFITGIEKREEPVKSI
jgi:glycosyltransferase 2 family protein